MSNKLVGDHQILVTLTDDNAKPLSQNYTLSLTVIENPSFTEDPLVIDESDSARQVSMEIIEVYSNGAVTLSLTEALLADNYEQLIKNLTESLTIKVSSSTTQDAFTWRITNYDRGKIVKVKLSFSDD